MARYSGKKAAINRIHGAYRLKCKKRNVYYDLTVEDMENLIFSNCAYCGIPPSNNLQRQDSHQKLKYNGLDRINPKHGYYLKNVVACCFDCNQLKSNKLTYDEMMAIAKTLNNFRKQKAA